MLCMPLLLAPLPLLILPPPLPPAVPIRAGPPARLLHSPLVFGWRAILRRFRPLPDRLPSSSNPSERRETWLLPLQVLAQVHGILTGVVVPSSGDLEAGGFSTGLSPAGSLASSLPSGSLELPPTRSTSYGSNGRRVRRGASMAGGDSKSGHWRIICTGHSLGGKRCMAPFVSSRAQRPCAVQCTQQPRSAQHSGAQRLDCGVIPAVKEDCAHALP